MKKLFLHGALADHLGFEVIELDVNTVSDAMRAIEVNTKKLYRYLLERDKIGVSYRVIIGEKDHEAEEDLVRDISEDEIHIVPVPCGQKAAVRIVAGVILVVIGTYYSMPWVSQLGWSLIIGGVTELIIGKPNVPELEDEKKSYLFNNQVNTVKQGGPIPIVYGEIVCGSQLINFNINSIAKNIGIAGGGIEPNPDGYFDNWGFGYSVSDQTLVNWFMFVQRLQIESIRGVG
jgi:predicted phage tail protein